MRAHGRADAARTARGGFSQHRLRLGGADPRERLGRRRSQDGVAARRPPLAAVERFLERRDRFRIAERAERLDGAQIHLPERTAMVDVADDVGEQRRRALVAQADDRLHDRFAGPFGAAGERLLQHLIRLLGPDVENRADRLALHLRLVVVEQLGQVGQRVAAAELAQQVDGRSPDGRIRRALQSLGGAFADDAEGDQDGREPLARPGALFDRQRLGERLDHHFAEREAHGLHPLELRLVHRRQVRDDVAHHRTGDEHVDGGDRVLTAAGGLAGRPLRCVRTSTSCDAASKSPTSSRSSMSATTGVIISPQRSSSSSMRSTSSTSVRSSARRTPVATVESHALTRSGGSSLTCSTSIARVRAPDSSRAVLVGHERLVAVGREQLLRDVVPHAFEAVGVAERRLGDVLVRQREQPFAVFLLLDERLEGQRQAIGRRR